MTKTKRWQLQEAKAKFSEVFEQAMTRGPQYITRRGKDEVVVVRRSEFDSLQKHRPSLLEALLACPKGPELKIHRDPSDTVGKGSRRIFEE